MLKLWIRGAKRELLMFRFTMKSSGQGLYTGLLATQPHIQNQACICRNYTK